MAFKCEGKEMYPIFVFAVLLVTKHAHREKPLPHKLCRFTSSLHALLVQHLYSEFFQYMIWHGPTSETAWMQRKQTN